jgi:DNA-binding NarL/FixJ family response regulator
VKRLQRDRAEAILAVQADPDVVYRRDPRGTQRRIQALVYEGWSISEIARRMGVAPQNTAEILNCTWVTQETHDRVKALFEVLAGLSPLVDSAGGAQSVTFARNHARKRGWVPALGWDDIDADPVPPVPPRPVAPGSVVERERRVVELHGLRWGDPRIAKELGTTDRTVLRIRQRLGLPGWSKEQQEAAA